MILLTPGVRRLWAVLPELRIAGGAVRDHLLGVAGSDIDFASPLSPDVVMARLADVRIKCVPTGIAHGTVTAVIGKSSFEITTLRRDVATDGRHAVVAFTDDWQEDAARRDFTMNAMFMTQDGTVFDYFGGQADLRAGLVRFVGDAAMRIAEDYLRILRFFRFFARYARGAADAEAIAAIAKLRDGVRSLSGERVWSETKRILQADDPRKAFALMQECGVLPLIFGEGADIAALDRLVGFGAPVEALLRVAVVFRGDVEALAVRLKLSHAEAELLQAYRRPMLLQPAASDADLHRALADEAPDILIARSWLAQDGAGWDGLRSRIAEMQRPVFPMQGRDVVALGVAAGPRVGEILQAVRLWWLENGCVDSPAACLERAKKLA